MFVELVAKPSVKPGGAVIARPVMLIKANLTIVVDNDSVSSSKTG
ncbi:hypothetical protein [Desulfomicrobium apsheronum]|nr:hypothetical protein [Desulfomicrobium apsheronum]